MGVEQLEGGGQGEETRRDAYALRVCVCGVWCCTIFTQPLFIPRAGGPTHKLVNETIGKSTKKGRVGRAKGREGGVLETTGRMGDVRERKREGNRESLSLSRPDRISSYPILGRRLTQSSSLHQLKNIRLLWTRWSPWLPGGVVYLLPSSSRACKSERAHHVGNRLFAALPTNETGNSRGWGGRRSLFSLFLWCKPSKGVKLVYRSVG
jgi:hypothetical protein